ncbi:MAG: aminopeptidase [Eubacterium sp.]|nr:aminopeptidase [Eubacterium sp.]
MSLHIFLTGLMIVATFTSLVTQAVKTLLDEHGKKYYSNTLAGIVSIILSVGLAIGYAVVKDISVDAAYIVYIVALTLLGWLSAIVGYDKVTQALAQIKDKK